MGLREIEFEHLMQDQTYNRAKEETRKAKADADAAEAQRDTARAILEFVRKKIAEDNMEGLLSFSDKNTRGMS